MPVRPKTYDRPGYREQSAKRREIERLAEADVADAYSIFNELTAGEKAELDPTLGYAVGWQDARGGGHIRGNSPEYEDGYLAGLAVRGETVQ